jgi:RimJ/RimL family protein N-acetyltransferase
MVPPSFTTRRLLLTPRAPRDLDAMAEMDADREVMRFVGEPQTGPEHRAELATWFDDSEDAPGHGGWTLRPLDEPDRYLGWVILYPLRGWEPDVEIGWRLVRDAWGHGYATEAARAIMDHAFGTVGLDRVVAVLDVDNDRSRRVCEKLGMHAAGLRRAYDADLALYVRERGGGP